MQIGLRRSVEILLDHEQQRATGRYVDLCISLRICDVDTSGPEAVYKPETDEEILFIGGRWDRKRKRWSAAVPERGRVLRIPRGSDQEQPARWIAEWLRRLAKGSKGLHWQEIGVMLGGRVEPIEFRRAWTLLLVGGRRGGKTHLAVVALVLLCVMIPGTKAIAVSPTQAETDELEQAARSLLPRQWFTVRGQGAGKDLQFKFANGSRILFVSGHKPRGLKRGRIDIALYNEAQLQYQAGWKHLRGAIVDSGGLVINSANPPDEPIGKWVEDQWERARAMQVDRKTRTLAIQAFHIIGKHNPFVTHEALEDMRAELDEVSARKEIDGEMGVPIGDVVWHAFSASKSVREVPRHFVDITAEVSRQRLGWAAGYLVGMDFQLDPAMCASIIKLYQDPDDDSKETLVWVVDEVVVEKADEYDLCDALEMRPRWTIDGPDESDCYRGWSDPNDKEPRQCVCIIDASGFTQDGAHNRGRTSEMALRARRWHNLLPPHAGSDRNPDISERVKVTNTRMKLADVAGVVGRRRMFFVPTVRRTIEAMLNWERKNGVPNRKSPYAHISDSVSYPVFRLFGKPRIRKQSSYSSVSRIGGGGGEESRPFGDGGSAF